MKYMSEKYNQYIKIVENVYKFDKFDENENENISILYNYGCLIRKSGNNEKALEIFELCKKKIDLKTDENIIYDIYINLGLIHSELNNSYDTILLNYENAIKIFNDRSEPYYYLGIYCNCNKYYEKAYEFLSYSINNISYEGANKKYKNIQYTAYDKFLYDELSIACYHLGKYYECIEYLNKIVDDPEFQIIKPRLIENLDLVKKKVSIINL